MFNLVLAQPDWEDTPNAYELTASMAAAVYDEADKALSDDGDILAAFDTDGNVRGLSSLQNWYEYDDGECEEGCPRNSSISIDEVGKSAPFGGFLSGNYTVELESSSLDKSDFPDGVPPYTTFGLKIETSVTWQADLENRTVWVKGASTQGCENTEDSSPVACDSSFIVAANASIPAGPPL